MAQKEETKDEMTVVTTSNLETDMATLDTDTDTEIMSMETDDQILGIMNDPNNDARRRGQFIFLSVLMWFLAFHGSLFMAIKYSNPPRLGVLLTVIFVIVFSAPIIICVFRFCYYYHPEGTMNYVTGRASGILFYVLWLGLFILTLLPGLFLVSQLDNCFNESCPVAPWMFLVCIVLATLAGLCLADITRKQKEERIEIYDFSNWWKLAAVQLNLFLVVLWISGVGFTFAWIIQGKFWWMLPMELLPFAARSTSCGNWVMNTICCKSICWWDRGDTVETSTTEIV